jgi:Conserved mid region of cactin
LEQARLRSTIRIQDGRAKPIDLLAKYVHSEEDIDAVEMHEPYAYLNGLTVKDLEDLIVDIKVRLAIKNNNLSQNSWKMCSITKSNFVAFSRFTESWSMGRILISGKI